MTAIAYLIVGVLVLIVAVPIVIFGAVLIGTVAHVVVSIFASVVAWLTGGNRGE